MAERSSQNEEAMIAAAQELFGRYSSLESSFDIAVCELYADDAVIRNYRLYPDGTREQTMPAPDYKAIIEKTMPFAQKVGDRSEYSNVTYAIEGSGVRVNAERYSVLKDYTSPLSLLLAPDPSGTWWIVEEISHSRSVEVEKALADWTILTGAVLPFAERMLQEQGEFFPYAGVLTMAGDYQPVMGLTGDEQPESPQVLALLRQALQAGEAQYLCTAIVFDTKLTRVDEDGVQQAAVAAELQHQGGFSVTIFRPYRLLDGNVVFEHPFMVPGEARASNRYEDSLLDFVLRLGTL